MPISSASALPWSFFLVSCPATAGWRVNDRHLQRPRYAVDDTNRPAEIVAGHHPLARSRELLLNILIPVHVRDVQLGQFILEPLDRLVVQHRVLGLDLTLLVGVAHAQVPEQCD